MAQKHSKKSEIDNRPASTPAICSRSCVDASSRIRTVASLDRIGFVVNLKDERWDAMKVTLEELRMLRSTLTAHRLQHEKLVTQTKLLRQRCQELRSDVAHTVNARQRFGREPALLDPGFQVA